MPNLLPEKNKKEIRKMFYLRSLIVFFIFVFLSAVVFCISLAPSYLLSVMRESTASERLEFVKNTIDFEGENSPASVVAFERKKISSLNTNDDSEIDLFIKKIVEQKKVGIRLTGFFYDSPKGENTETTLVVNGSSDNRSILIDFVEGLETESVFSKIDFPVSNLVKDEEVDFSIKIYIKENDE